MNGSPSSATHLGRRGAADLGTVGPSAENGPGVGPAGAEVEGRCDGEVVVVAGWPVARQHPRGRNGTVFVTIEDETGDVQLILWPRVFARCRARLRSRVIQATGQVSRWDGTTNIIASGIETIDTAVPMPAAHDWH